MTVHFVMRILYPMTITFEAMLFHVTLYLLFGCHILFGENFNDLIGATYFEGCWLF